MTRFLLSLDEAVEVIFAALRSALQGEIYVPAVPAARIVDVAEALIGDRPIEIAFTEIRPGEKVHELLVSAEEALRTGWRDGYYVVQPLLPELQQAPLDTVLDGELSSGTTTLSKEQVVDLLERHAISAATTADDLVR
jgi:UDP-glucose 4-epimerase